LTIHRAFEGEELSDTIEFFIGDPNFVP